MPANIDHSYPMPDEQSGDHEFIRFLLGKPPSWMLRYGISVVAGVFLSVLALAYFIRYPDVVETKCVLTTARPPIRILSAESGRIASLLVEDRQLVKAGAVLAVMENTANWKDVARLENWLGKAPDPTQETPPAGLQLGDLQDAYSLLCQHWNDFRYFSGNDGPLRKADFLKQQIAQLQAINENLAGQKSIMQEEYALATREVERQRKLHGNDVASDIDLEKSEAEYLRQKRQIEAAGAAILQNRVQIRQLEGQIDDLRTSRKDDAAGKSLTLAEDINRMLGAIGAWKQRNLIAAPIDGRVSFSKIWSARQAVGAGEEIMAVVPEEEERADGNTVIGKASVSSADAGKLKTGMQAVIRPDGYSPNEYGSINAVIAGIALIPQEGGGGYLIDLGLPNGLVTGYGKAIPLRQEMPCTVRITTEEKRVLQRIFGRLHDLLKR